MLISLLDLGPKPLNIGPQLASLGQTLGTDISNYGTQQDIAKALQLGTQPAQTAPLTALFSQSGAPAPITSTATSTTASTSDPVSFDPKSVPSFVKMAGSEAGLAPDFLPRVAQIESKFDPNAQNKSGAKGLFQFMPSTWASYGDGGNPFDPNAASAAVANLTTDNANTLEAKLGRPVTQGEGYLAHQQGAGGALALLSNPDQNVVAALAPVYGGNMGKAAQAVVQNGGKPNMTAGQFASLWTSKFPNTPLRTDPNAMSTSPGQDPGIQVSAPVTNPDPRMSVAPPVANADPGMNVGALPQMAQAAQAQPTMTPAAGGLNLDPGSAYRLKAAAQAAPNLPAARVLAPNIVAANPSIGNQTVAQLYASISGGGQPAPQQVAQADLPAPGARPMQGGFVVPGSNGAPPMAAAQYGSGLTGVKPGDMVPVQPQMAPQAPQGSQQAAPVPSAPDDMPVVVPGFPGQWTRARAAQTDPNDTSTPDAQDVAAAQAAARGGPASTGSTAGAPMQVSPPVQQAAQGGFQPGSVAVPGQQQAAVQPTLPPQLAKMAGFTPDQADLVARLATSGNPTAAAMATSIISTRMGKGAGWDLKELANGQSVLFNAQTGAVMPIPGAQKPTTYSMQKGSDGNDYVFNPQTGQMTRAVAGTPKVETVAAGSTVFDPKTRQPVYTAPSDKTDDKGYAVVQIGQDQFGNKVYGSQNKGTGAITPLAPPTPAGGGSAGAPQPGQPGVTALHGADFLATLDPNTAGQVKAIVEGRAPYPTGMLLKTPYGQQLAAYVTQADPTFETGNATSRVRVRTEFNAGGPSSPAGMITAGNTAIQHLGHLSDAAEALNNGRLPILNKIENAAAQGTGGGTAVTQFNNILGKYVEEATKFYRGSGGTEADIQRDLGNLNPNMSPAQLRSAIQTQVELLQSKINAMQDRWKQGMGPLVPDFPIIQPDSKQSLDKIAKRAGIAPQNSQTAPQAGGAPATPQQSSAQTVPEGSTATNPQTRQRVIFRNGAWQPLTGPAT